MRLATFLNNSAPEESDLTRMPSPMLNPSTAFPYLAMDIPRQAYTSGGLTLAPPNGLQGRRPLDQPKWKAEEYESKSGSDNMEGGSGDEQEPDQSSRKKRYHRHSAHQIQQMESFFKECPHPDEKQRQELGRALKLSARQVKFWFQNRRTQMKAQQERTENCQLRSENERLKTENITMREAIKHASCPSCGGPSALGEMASFHEHQLRVENVRLRDELQHVSTVAARHFGRPVPPLVSVPPMFNSSSMDLAVGTSFSALNVIGGSSVDIFPGPSVADVALRPGGLTELEKPIVVELAVAALDELLRMCHADEPVWMKSGDGTEVLNLDEYLHQFPAAGMGAGPSLGLKTEATRDAGLVITNGAMLVEALMDEEKWAEMFSSVVAKAVTVEVLSPGIGSSRDGALQLMYAELQMLSPLVQTRELYFLRYCKQAAEKVWAVVDVSVDSLRDNPPPSLLRCRRRPSGCLIQDMPNGYSQVTWIEHVEADDRGLHQIFRPLVNSGMAFGARRWLATLQRHCERLVSLLATNISPRDLGVIQSPEGRRAMLRLAQKMSHGFCSNVAASSSNSWLTLSSDTGDLDVRVMMRENPGDGVLLCAATSSWLPFASQRVFDFLRDERTRAEWDVLANGSMEKMCHIAEGQHPGNSVSLLRANVSIPNQSNVIFLQESCTDASGSLIVYAPVDLPTLNMVLQGEEPLRGTPPPSGFVILPDGPESRPSGLLLNEAMDNQSAGGSLLTISIQIAVSHVPTSGKLNLESVNTVSNIIINTLQNIKAALQRGVT